MAYTRTWNAGNEAVPADTDNASGGAEEFRALKVDIRERFAKEHGFELADGEEQGVHKFNVGDTASRPTGTSGRMYFNSEYNTIDFYDGAAWNVVGIPSGTRMLFQQTAAPVGWTKDTTANLNDTALRVVTGTVGNRTTGDAFSTSFAAGRSSNAGEGGSNTGSTVVTINNTNLGLSIANTNLGLSVAGHALSVAELPSHYHYVAKNTSNNGAIGAGNYIPVTAGYGDNASYTLAGQASEPDVGRTSSTGSGSTHTHTLNGTTGNHTHTLNGSTGNHAHTANTHNHTTPDHVHTTDMDVNYHDVVICTKD